MTDMDSNFSVCPEAATSTPRSPSLSFGLTASSLMPPLLSRLAAIDTTTLPSILTAVVPARPSIALRLICLVNCWLLECKFLAGEYHKQDTLYLCQTDP
ncbi:hypothetical protein P8452_23505 [Trifolium repens]|nr:hypothetical protein P8452_23505 [Trifolium repens]